MLGLVVLSSLGSAGAAASLSEPPQPGTTAKPAISRDHCGTDHAERVSDKPHHGAHWPNVIVSTAPLLVPLETNTPVALA